MLISVIIPAFNEEKLLPATLKCIKGALRPIHERGWKSEIIVCDNNSTDRTAEIAQAEGARVVFEPVNQIARARNSGARVAAGDWFLFVDADSYPTPQLFSAVVHQIQSGRCLAGGAVVKMDEFHYFAAILVRVWNWTSRTFRYMAGSFVFCDAAAFRELGGFSQELYASEEIDLSRRLKVLAQKQGKEIVILRSTPMLTSSRKMHLYTTGEYLRFIFRAVFDRGHTLRNRETCAPWYDGRR